MFAGPTLVGKAWWCRGRSLPSTAFLVAILLILFLPKASSGQKPLILRPDGGVYQIAFSPNSQFLAASCSKGTVYFWDLTAEKPPHAIAADQSPGRLLGFAPESKQLVTVVGTARGLIVKRWETDTGKPAGNQKIDGWQGGRYLALSPDCKKVAVTVAGQDKNEKTAIVFDADSGRNLLTLEMPGTVAAAVFSPDNETLVTAFNTAENAAKRIKVTARVRFSRLSDGKQQGEFQVPFLVNALAFSEDGKSLAAGGRGLKIWDWHRGDWLEESQLRTVRAEHLALSSDGRVVVCGGQVWDLQTKKLLREVKNAFGPLALSPDGKKLAIEVGRELHVYDLPSPAALGPNKPKQD